MKIKLISFDLEGTIIKPLYKHEKYKGLDVAPSLWTKIAEYLGKDALLEEERTKVRWTRGEYRNYMEWAADTIRMYKKYGLTRDKFVEFVKDSIRYYRGVKKTFKELNRRKIVTVIITGGFKELADIVQQDLKITHSFSSCEIFFNEKGRIIHFNLLPTDYRGKVEFMKLLMKEYGLKREECAFVGDGKNDIPLAKMVGLSISFNGDPELEKVCKAKIRGEDFSGILDFI